MIASYSSLASSHPSASPSASPSSSSSSDNTVVFPYPGETVEDLHDTHSAKNSHPNQPETDSLKGTQRQRIQPYISFDQVQPFSKAVAFMRGIDVRAMRRQIFRDLDHPQRREFRKRILFFGVSQSRDQLGRIVKQHSLVPYASLFGRSYSHLMDQIDSRPNSAIARYELAQRFNIVAAQLAQEQAYFLVSSEEDARNPNNVWNMYARPTLQKRGVPIVWLNAEGERRGSIYPHEVMPPAVEQEPQLKGGPGSTGGKGAKTIKSDTGVAAGANVGSELDEADLGKRLQLKTERARMKGRGKGRGKRRHRRSVEPRRALPF